MIKSIIAIDIDDVLSVHVQAFIDYSNAKYGTVLTIEDYSEHWGDMWGVDHVETEKRANDYHLSGVIDSYKPDDQAMSVLMKLAEKYTLIVVTARRRQVTKVTEEWIKEHFPDVFGAIYHAGIWDKITDQSNAMTKAKLCKKIGAKYLIDDQLKHCIAAAQENMTGLLFGNYPWNKADILPTGIHRVKDWGAVKEYFDAERG